MSGVDPISDRSIAEISFTFPNDRKWAERTEELLGEVERCLSGVKLLEWDYRDKEPVEITKSERLRLLRSTQRTKLRYFSVSDVGFTRSFAFNQYLNVGGSSCPLGDAPHHTLMLTGSLLASKFNERLLIDLACVSGPFTATFLPWDSVQLLNVHKGIAGNYAENSVQVGRLRLKLPRMVDILETGYLTQEQPLELGWINYWSPATREFLGFPEDFKGDAMFRYSYEGPEGSVIFKLTEEPLDLTRDDHITCYANALKRFPRFACLAPSR